MDNELIQTIGRLEGTVTAQTNDISKLFALVTEFKDDFHKTMNELPCKVHGEQIENIEDWKKCQNGTKREADKSRISLKNGLIIGLSCACIGGIISMIVNAIAKAVG